MVCSKRKLYPLLFGFAVVALTMLAAPLTAATFKDLEKNVVEKVLPNGIKVIILPRPVAPVISMVTYADVGSVDEITGITGMAHIFEHMAFKGTQTIGTKDYAKEKEALQKVDEAFLDLKAERDKGRFASSVRVKELEEAFNKAQDEAGQYVIPNQVGEIVERTGGVGLNAFTSLDQTVYHYSLPSNKLEFWAALEADRFTRPVLREFYKETSVIREERRMGFESSPQGKLFEELFAAAYKAHPYHVLVLGHMSDLESITRAEAMDWFDKYYSGKNLTVGVVGDVDPATAMPILEKYLSQIPAGTKPTPVETVEPPQRGIKRVAIEDKAQPFLAIAYHRPERSSPDHATFEVVTTLLGGGRTSRLYKRLVKEEKLALYAGCEMVGDKYPGLFMIFSLPNKDKTTEENETAIMEEIERLKKEPVPVEELKSVKARERSEFINSLGNNTGLAMNLTEFEKINGSWREMFNKLDLIDKVTSEDVMRVAKEYLSLKNATVAEIVKPES
jgi:predicted Zn-dependent peptidase